MFPESPVGRPQARAEKDVSRRRPVGWWIPAAVLLVIAGLGCAGVPKPVRTCLSLEGSANLNLYQGQPHAVTLYLFPLAGRTGFDQASVSDLLEVASCFSARRSAGCLAPNGARPPVPITVGPGQTVPFDQPLTPGTAYVGIVADYYRAPGDPEGRLKDVVPAKCSMFSTQRISLLPQELVAD